MPVEKSVDKNGIHILVVEDESDQRDLIVSILSAAGYRVDQVGSAEEALDKLSQGSFDIVLSDWKLPGIDGEQMLKRMREQLPDIGFILATAYGSIAHAVKIIRAGADDYLAKPFEKESLLFTVEKVARNLLLISENRELLRSGVERRKLVDLIGKSASMQKLYQQIEKIAPTEATILISGESGTGKELVARALHQLSRRNDKQFLAVNCAAIPESIAEAELFGAEKGAFTGAYRRTIGKIESADGGTLFLDEIGELSLNIQAKLLRVLQESTLTRVGGVEELRLDIRIITATHRNLKQWVEKGKFREDLFYRLNVIPIEVPPLRERRDDIADLVNYFIRRTAKSHDVSLPAIDRSAMKLLVHHVWEGNVRELGNVVERLVLLCDRQGINAESVRESIVKPAPVTDDYQLPVRGIDWEQLEKSMLQQALASGNNNRTQAAKLLKLSYKTFLYRLEKHGL